MFKNILFLFSIFFLVQFTISQKNKNSILTLDKVLMGKIDKDNSFDYYELSLPKNIPKNNLLVFTARESKILINENDEVFSDPDILISKKNKKIKNISEADWYSQTFGNDIITIPSKDLVKLGTLYVALYCEKKCRYNLKAYLTKEIEFNLGNMNSIKLSNHNSINYRLPIKNIQYEELKIVAYSPEQKHFHILVSKDNDSPSTQNSIQAIPSWMGGYMINIKKGTNNYCTNCTFHVLFQTEEESASIKFYAFIQDTFIIINSGEPLMDSMEKDSQRCYIYEMGRNYYSNSNDTNSDKLIIQLTLFGGSALLHITGWNKEIFSTNDLNKIKDYGYHIISEKTIMLSEKDTKIFDQEFDPNKNGEKKKLHFCIYGIEKGSYSINVNYLNEITTLQRYNNIFPGNQVNGYLPDKQITSYKIIDNNINKNSNITITLKNIQGKSELYGYFCDIRKDYFCSFGNYRLNQKLEANEMLLSNHRFSSSDNSLIIESKDNQCYSGSKNNDKNCKLLAVIKCVEPENNLCAYSILSTITDHPIMMTPKKTYYNFISTGKTDIYKIVITEPDINSLVVVLTSNIGDAELSISRESDKENDKSEPKLIAISNNKYYLPDVIRVTPKILNSKTLIGKYIIKIYCKYYSSYNLYYYTTKSKIKKEKISSNDITATLTDGQVITDFFPNNIKYKIYSYTPGDKTQKDIKITLTRVNVRFTFYVYLSLRDIKFNANLVSIYDERISGYNWISDSNNEVTISTKDKKYKKKGPYYIVVLRDLTTDIDNHGDEKIDDDLIMRFYLGATKEGKPFYLKEGVEHSVTLTKNYKYQNYLYTHYNFSQPFQLVVNILNGQVDVFISNKEIKPEDFENVYNSVILNNINNSTSIINYNSSSIYVKQRIGDYSSIVLEKDFFYNIYYKNYLNENTNSNNITINKCDLFIYIIQSRLSLKFERDSQYIITGKTSFQKANFLLSGHVYKNKMKPNTKEYFIIEEVKHRESLTITVRFTQGTGDFYVNVVDNNEEAKLNNLIFPNSTHHDYKGTSVYMGKMINIPGEYFDKIGKSILKLKILITIEGSTYSSNNKKEIEYYLSYSNEAKRINQNIPYQSSIREGEYQYYTFYFDKNTENILISLSNMNGDADMFLNYGNKIYPTPVESDWISNSIGHEYIDINKDDPFFKKNNINDLSGYYTLLVVGYTRTTYTLFVSSHDEYIFKLVENTPVNCKCETKDDKCYFRYDDIINKREQNLLNNTNINSTEIIFTSQYLYGNGKMYASVLKEQQIYSNSENKKYIDYFPNETNFDVSNSEMGKRNYLKLRIPNIKYSLDSLVLMTFVCEEKTDVEINISPLSPSGEFKYISSDRENIFYLRYNESLSDSKQPQTILSYYFYKESDAIYEFHAYTGRAKIHIYTNETKWNNVTNGFDYEYNHISSFVIQGKLGKNELQDYRYSKYFTEEYFNTIPNYLCKGKTVLFSVTPLTNFGFYLQITNDRNWINIPIGRDKTYYVKNKVLYGYFDIFDEYSSVEMSMYLKSYTTHKAIIYLKLIVDDKKKKVGEVNESNNNDKDKDKNKDKLKHHEIPSSTNYDFKAQTDSYSGAMNINIDNIPVIKKEEKYTKIVRALFAVHVYYNYNVKSFDRFSGHKSLIIPEHQTRISPFNNKFDYGSFKDVTLNILVSPGVNNFKRIDTVPYTFYFSNTSLLSNNNLQNTNKIYNGNKEIKIYSLDKISDQHNKMIIQINTCKGDYNIKISSKVVNYDDNSNDINFAKLSSRYGRTIYLLDKLKFKHIYVSIKPKQIENDCSQGMKKDSNNVTCSNELSYLMHYYSATDKQYRSTEPNRKLSFRAGNNDKELVLIIPKLKDYDYHNNFRDKKNVEYNLFYTYNKTYSSYIESICYLGHIMEANDESEITLIKNIALNDLNEYTVNNIDYGKSIYLNVLARNLKTNELIIFKPIKGRLAMSITTKIVVLFIALFFVLLIIYISSNYYYEDNLDGYNLTKSDDTRSDIRYTNINFSPGL